jgi:hypothetical protein
MSPALTTARLPQSGNAALAAGALIQAAAQADDDAGAVAQDGQRLSRPHPRKDGDEQ